MQNQSLFLYAPISKAWFVHCRLIFKEFFLNFKIFTYRFKRLLARFMCLNSLVDFCWGASMLGFCTSARE